MRKRLSDSPILVPPSQSNTSLGRLRSASSGSRLAQHARQAGQPGPEAVGLPAGIGLQRGMGEHEQGARIGRHRPRDVEEEDESPRPAVVRPPRSTGSRRFGTSGGSCGGGRGRPTCAFWRLRRPALGTASRTRAMRSASWPAPRRCSARSSSPSGSRSCSQAEAPPRRPPILLPSSTRSRRRDGLSGRSCSGGAGRSSPKNARNTSS